MLEVPIDTLDAARLACLNGADRLETCGCLGSGGVTPNMEFVKAVDAIVEECGARTTQRVMIRPREGNFFYSGEDVALAKTELLALKAEAIKSVEGFVFGFLTQGENKKVRLNQEACKSMDQLTSPLKWTFHRAFDMVDPDSWELDLEWLSTNCRNCDFVLTTGLGAKTVETGLATLQTRLVPALTAHDITPIIGGGVRATNAQRIIDQLKPNKVWLHSSCRIRVGDDDDFMFRYSVCAPDIKQLSKCTY